jgi:hypothetical protein
MRLPSIVMVLLLTGACAKKDSPTAPTAPVADSGPATTFAFVSDPASRVGRGESPTYTRANATFQVGTDSQFVSVGVVPQGAGEVLWRFTFHPPRNQKLAAGTFPLLGVGSNTGHGFEFSGRGNQCSSGSGTLTIEDILNTGLVERLAANFSISCDGTPAVNGRIVLNWVAGAGYR